jgi:2-hydroxy-3-oxopropionate reductase
MNIKTIAVLGTGLMGAPMAKRLLNAGLEVHVWNRSPDKAQALDAFGATVAATAAQAAAQADVVITMLQDGDAVGHVLFTQGAAKAMQAHAVLVDMSSIAPAQAQAHAQQLAHLGLKHIDAPVSGGTVGAEQGLLAIMAGGDIAVFDLLTAVFTPLGRAVHVGPSGSGQLAKLANQMIVGITIGAVAEALLLAEKGGADMAKVREAISGGFAQSRILDLHGQRMVDRDFTKRAAMAVQLKDMRNALTTAHSLGFEAPVTAMFEDLYAQAINNGLADLDHSALFVELARRNGMR